MSKIGIFRSENNRQFVLFFKLFSCVSACPAIHGRVQSGPIKHFQIFIGVGRQFMPNVIYVHWNSFSNAFLQRFSLGCVIHVDLTTGSASRSFARYYYYVFFFFSFFFLFRKMPPCHSSCMNSYNIQIEQPREKRRKMTIHFSLPLVSLILCPHRR